MKTCVFAGSFDPITVGHEEVVNISLKRYDKVIIIIGENAQKTPFFEEFDRYNLVKETFNENANVIVYRYSQLKDNFAKFLQEEGATVYVRGIRDKKDLVFEKQFKKINAKLYPFIKTKFIKLKKHKEVSSSLVKELLLNGKDATEYLPKKVANKVIEIYNRKANKQ